MIGDLKKILLAAMKTAGWLLFLAIWVWFGWLMGIRQGQREAYYVKREANYHQPTIEQQQQYLMSLDSERYDVGEVDGIAGPRFCKALNNWQMDQYAARSFLATPVDFKKNQDTGATQGCAD